MGNCTHNSKEKRNQTFLNLSLLRLDMFLKKLLRWVTSVKPKARAISDTLQLLCLSIIFASWRIGSVMFRYCSTYLNIKTCG